MNAKNPQESYTIKNNKFDLANFIINNLYKFCQEEYNKINL
jgi:hypothetical protein